MVTTAERLHRRPGEPAFGPKAEVVDPNFSTPDLGPTAPGVLAAGSRARSPSACCRPRPRARPHLKTETETLNSTETTTIDWTTLLSGDRPTGLSLASWSKVKSDVASVLGTTDGTFAHRFLELVHQAAADGVIIKSEPQGVLWAVEQQIAEGAGANVTGTVYLGSTTSPLARQGAHPHDIVGKPGLHRHLVVRRSIRLLGRARGTYTLTALGHIPRPAATVDVDPSATGLSVVVTNGATLAGKVTNSKTASR